MITEGQVIGMPHSDSQPRLYWKNPIERLDFPNECLVVKSSLKSPYGLYFHGTVREKEWIQKVKKKIPQNEEDSGTEWIFI